MECEEDESAIACVTSCLRWACEKKRLEHRSKEIAVAHLGCEQQQRGHSACGWVDVLLRADKIHSFHNVWQSQGVCEGCKAQGEPASRWLYK